MSTPMAFFGLLKPTDVTLHSVLLWLPRPNTGRDEPSMLLRPFPFRHQLSQPITRPEYHKSEILSTLYSKIFGGVPRQSPVRLRRNPGRHSAIRRYLEGGPTSAAVDTGGAPCARHRGRTAPGGRIPRSVFRVRHTRGLSPAASVPGRPCGRRLRTSLETHNTVCGSVCLEFISGRGGEFP